VKAVPAIVRRLVVILFAYVAAAFAASVLFVPAYLLLDLAIGSTLRTSNDMLKFMGSAPEIIMFGTSAIALFAFVPAFLAIAVAERLARRNWTFYALAGGLAGVVANGVAGIFFLRWGTQAGRPWTFDPAAVLATLGGGVVGGLAYWLIAGRSAGGVRKAEAQPAPPAAD
jgi:hypothetical protein